MLKMGGLHKQGFTLVEVLVSMVILAIGLLGLAALQARALKDNQDAYYYSQASLLAYEMGDRIKANQAYWGERRDSNGIIITPTELNSIPDPSSARDCTSPDETCTPEEMAAFDFNYWQTAVQRILPAPTSNGAKIVDIQRSSDVGIDPCTGTGASVCLITQWSRTNSNVTNSMLSADMIYRFEVSP